MIRNSPHRSVLFDLFVTTGLVLLLLCDSALSYYTLGEKWPDGYVTMQLQLGSPSGALMDGSTSWNASAESALAIWNNYLGRVRFQVVRDSTVPIGSNNYKNNVFFDDTVYGMPFGTGVLAVELTWPSGASTITESDVIFNTNVCWNSYRGPQKTCASGGGLYDLRRVALHEFGHTLGLRHPDEYGQSVVALMNSHIGDLDTLASDDIAGARYLYGGVPAAPAVVTLSAGSVGSTTATLNGSVNPNGGVSSTGFDYGSSSYVSISSRTVTGSGSQATWVVLSGLTCGTVYYFRAKATNNGGTTYGADLSFTTLPCPRPSVTTVAASGVTQSTATLNGSVNPNGYLTTTAFDYGSSSYGSIAAQTVTGTGFQPTSVALSGLMCGTVYYFRAKATNSGGTTYGADLSFTTLPCPRPSVTTVAVSRITQSTVTLNGSVNPNGYLTTSGFDYGISSYVSLSAQTLTGTSSQATSVDLSGLTCGTLYYFRAKATNSWGTAYGADLTFTTLPCLRPTVTTVAASSVSQSTASLNAVVNPNWLFPVRTRFDYGPTTAYGRSAEGATITGGPGPFWISAPAVTLACGTNYHFRTAASNARGTSYGADLTFTTPHCNTAPNDACSAALVAGATPASWGVSTASATTEVGDPTPYLGSRGHSVWFNVTPARTGKMWVDTLGSLYNTVVTLFTGTCGAWTALPGGGSDDAGGTLQSQVGIWVTRGVTYGIMVTGYSAADSGDLQVHVRMPTQGDYDGDEKGDLTVYRPSTGEWWGIGSAKGYAWAGGYLRLAWGQAGDVPMPGDYDGDGRMDMVVYRPATGDWWGLLSSHDFAVQAGYLAVSWGWAGDVPISGDYDGDGRTDLGIFRPSTGDWWILRSSDNYDWRKGFLHVGWGAAGDIQVPGDYDGDGRTDVAVYRPSTGNWWVLRSSDNYDVGKGYLYGAWGTSADVPIQGDFDGDGRADFALYRPSSGEWFVLKSSNGYMWQFGYLHVAWGASFQTPVPADYDGDGKTDIAVYTPATGDWWILRSTNNYVWQPTLGYFNWGGVAGDVPIGKTR